MLDLAAGAFSRSFAYDVGAAERLPDWRATLASPYSPPEIGAVFRRSFARAVEYSESLEGAERRLAIAALSAVSNIALGVLSASLCLQRERESGARPLSHEPEFEFLSGDSLAPPPARSGKIVESLSRPKFPLRRSLQVVKRWTRWRDLPTAAFVPDAVAVAANNLLIAEARARGGRIWFSHSGVFAAAARARGRRLKGVDLDGMAISIAERYVSAAPLEEPWRARAQALVQANCAAVLPVIAQDLAGLEALAKLPNEIWGGSGFYYQSRILGLEALRRHIPVVRFDHGGTLGMVRMPEDVAVTELQSCSRFVMNSERFAQNLRNSGATKLVASPPEIVGGRGDQAIRQLPLNRSPRRRLRPRVVYAPTMLPGFVRRSYSLQPDSVVLDWTLRVAEALRALPIDLLCKPHPEGVFKGRRHPVEAIAPTSKRPFEEEMEEADVFVFDRYHSTTFWEALCTDRTVVYLAASPAEFYPDVEPLLRSRCRFVDVWWDERNLPQFDSRELKEAILSGPDQSDPAAFQELLVGQRVS